MGVYIKGVKMPRSCRDCFVNMVTSAFPACPLAENYAAGKALVVEGLGNNIRPDGCPLVYIPPHGDLIDRAEVVDSFDPSDFWNPDAEDNCFAAIRIVNAAPTIIPAEEGE